MSHANFHETTSAPESLSRTQSVGRQNIGSHRCDYPLFGAPEELLEISFAGSAAKPSISWIYRKGPAVFDELLQKNENDEAAILAVAHQYQLATDFDERHPAGF